MSLRFATEPRTPRRLLGRQGAQDLLSRRMPWIMGSMALWALLIFLRLLWLQGVEHKRYQAKADQQHTVVVPIPPIRGELRDRRGEPLAIAHVHRDLQLATHRCRKRAVRQLQTRLRAR